MRYFTFTFTFTTLLGSYRQKCLIVLIQFQHTPVTSVQRLLSPYSSTEPNEAWTVCVSTDSIVSEEQID